MTLSLNLCTPPLRRQAHWRLLSHLNLNQLSLTDAEQGKTAIQEYLRLYDFADPKTDPQLSAVAAQVIDGLLAVRSKRTVQFAGSQTAGGYARGVAVDAELAQHEWDRMKRTDSRECRNCHNFESMDFTRQTCTVERRKRCADSVPKVLKLITEARGKGALIVYSVAVPNSVPGDILPELTPAAGEQVLPPPPPSCGS